jgi:hypothetical protein
MTEAQQPAAGCTRYPGGKDAVQAIADVYGLSRTDAFKRMGRFPPGLALNTNKSPPRSACRQVTEPVCVSIILP